MEITSELIKKIKNAESPRELVEIARENDADISLKDAEMIFSALLEKKDD